MMIDKKEPYEYAEKVILKLKVIDQSWIYCGICNKPIGITTNDVVGCHSGLAFVCPKCFQKHGANQ